MNADGVVVTDQTSTVGQFTLDDVAELLDTALNRGLGVVESLQTLVEIAERRKKGRGRRSRSSHGINLADLGTTKGETHARGLAGHSDSSFVSIGPDDEDEVRDDRNSYRRGTFIIDNSSLLPEDTCLCDSTLPSTDPDRLSLVGTAEDPCSTLCHSVTSFRPSSFNLEQSLLSDSLEDQHFTHDRLATPSRPSTFNLDWGVPLVAVKDLCTTHDRPESLSGPSTVNTRSSSPSGCTGDHRPRTFLIGTERMVDFDMFLDDSREDDDPCSTYEYEIYRVDNSSGYFSTGSPDPLDTDAALLNRMNETSPSYERAEYDNSSDDMTSSVCTVSRHSTAFEDEDDEGDTLKRSRPRTFIMDSSYLASGVHLTSVLHTLYGAANQLVGNCNDLSSAGTSQFCGELDRGASELTDVSAADRPDVTSRPDIRRSICMSIDRFEELERAWSQVTLPYEGEDCDDRSSQASISNSVVTETGSLEGEIVASLDDACAVLDHRNNSGRSLEDDTQSPLGEVLHKHLSDLRQRLQEKRKAVKEERKKLWEQVGNALVTATEPSPNGDVAAHHGLQCFWVDSGDPEQHGGPQFSPRDTSGFSNLPDVLSTVLQTKEMAQKQGLSEQHFASDSTALKEHKQRNTAPRPSSQTKRDQHVQSTPKQVLDRRKLPSSQPAPEKPLRPVALWGAPRNQAPRGHHRTHNQGRHNATTLLNTVTTQQDKRVSHGISEDSDCRGQVRSAVGTDHKRSVRPMSTPKSQSATAASGRAPPRTETRACPDRADEPASLTSTPSAALSRSSSCEHVPYTLTSDKRTLSSKVPLTIAGGPQPFAMPSGRSNRRIIFNAVSHCCLPGEANRETKERCLEVLSQTDAPHFLVLFRDGMKFRGLYSYYPDIEQMVKVFGIGPRIVVPSMVHKLFKYMSGAKEFQELVGARTVSISCDGMEIKKDLWQSTSKPVASRTDSNVRRA